MVATPNLLCAMSTVDMSGRYTQQPQEGWKAASSQRAYAAILGASMPTHCLPNQHTHGSKASLHLHQSYACTCHSCYVTYMRSPAPRSPPTSSSWPKANSRLRAGWKPCRSSASAASSSETTPTFTSCAPLPHTAPSATAPLKGGWRQSCSHAPHQQQAYGKAGIVAAVGGQVCGCCNRLLMLLHSRQHGS